MQNHICVSGTGREELKKEAEMLKRELRALKKSEKEKDKVEREEDASPTDKGNVTLFFITALSIATKGHVCSRFKHFSFGTAVVMQGAV